MKKNLVGLVLLIVCNAFASPISAAVVDLYIDDGIFKTVSWQYDEPAEVYDDWYDGEPIPWELRIPEISYSITDALFSANCIDWAHNGTRLVYRKLNAIVFMEFSLAQWYALKIPNSDIASITFSIDTLEGGTDIAFSSMLGYEDAGINTDNAEEIFYTNRHCIQENNIFRINNIIVTSAVLDDIMSKQQFTGFCIENPNQGDWLINGCYGLCRFSNPKIKISYENGIPDEHPVPEPSSLMYFAVSMIGFFGLKLHKILFLAISGSQPRNYH
jgi:hypothetical protein